MNGVGVQQYLGASISHLLQVTASGSRVWFLAEQLVHLAETVGQDFHDVGGEEWIQLNQMEEPALVNFCEPTRFAGDDGSAAWRLVNKRHLADDCTPCRVLNHPAADDDIHLAFEQDKHGVTGVTRLEKRVTGREVYRVSFTGE